MPWYTFLMLGALMIKLFPHTWCVQQLDTSRSSNADWSFKKTQLFFPCDSSRPSCCLHLDTNIFSLHFWEILSAPELCFHVSGGVSLAVMPSHWGQPWLSAGSQAAKYRHMVLHLQLILERRTLWIFLALYFNGIARTTWIWKLTAHYQEQNADPGRARRFENYFRVEI